MPSAANERIVLARAAAISTPLRGSAVAHGGNPQDRAASPESIKV
ncbi:hypothetical protein [Nostoc sp. DSM 114160]|jgi:hypothetical protein